MLIFLRPPASYPTQPRRRRIVRRDSVGGRDDDVILDFINGDASDDDFGIDRGNSGSDDLR